MRKIQAPGLEVNEIDLSEYANTDDYSIIDTTVMLNGFTDKGIDYQTKYVNSMATYKKMFGNPTNEAETYLYNATNEVISRGGVAYVTKIPYDNDTYNQYSYTTYEILSDLTELSTTYDIIDNNKTSTNLNLYEFLFKPDEDYINWFNNNQIYLDVITDLFNFLKTTINFKYQITQAINDIFYVKGTSYAKNKSVYMLEKLNDSIETLSAYVDDDEKLLISAYYDDLVIMRNQLTDFGDFNTQISSFAKNKSLSYYRNYLVVLSSHVAHSIKDTSIRDTISGLIDEFSYNDLMKTRFTGLRQNDPTLTSFIEIKSMSMKETGFISMEDYDRLKIKTSKVAKNRIQFIDIKRNKYDSEYNVIDEKDPKEYLGIMPVITTPANALYYQKIIENDELEFKEYNALKDIQNIYSDNTKNTDTIRCSLSNLNNDSDDTIGFVQNIGSESNAEDSQLTLSKTAASFFPKFTFVDGCLDREYVKSIGVVVFEMYVDKSSNYKIAFTPVESYVGSLNRYAQDMITKQNMFIDDIINQKSSRINCFSNVEFSKNGKNKLTNADKASIFIIANQTATSLGFYHKDCDKDISVSRLNSSLDRIFDLNNDRNHIEFDLLVDAGVSNIGQFIKSVYDDSKGEFDLQSDNAWKFNLDKTSEWALILNKYDNYCKNTRKDCMFIADGLRPLCVNGDYKIVRNTKPTNTIENTILKNISKISGIINSSYGAGYCDWFYSIDAYSNMYFWCPPSIKAAGIYIYTDAYYNFWDAPAGLNRGRLPEDVIDVAFSPTIDEAGTIYNNNWNYSVSYPLDGIIQEGQRTFQKNKTALDRVNVRRLMLGLERSVRYVAKYFVYEGITDYLMERFVDSLEPIFENAKNKGGISEYYIKCDRDNNTINTIENNELHCTIAIKPIKTLEFLILNLICTNQSANVQEIAENNS